eukprot:CAMPEP_0117026962 /NCGR_PEP_ID=MMETSP0472-20121206/19766_1 /TAXON_ID=693140 ORGANISM="Tiarina fusus, Strain LIS" /NCGR_SAMPLE_ID=MMETSP0472 /ASSEMBLY_ACC=CAM_ASM_000603 /LENGTH=145 /DNA_ID=CAMNT_0004734103 /DNA_START=46 /DNA_END=483 /DNA_ORIENTATION=+
MSSKQVTFGDLTIKEYPMEIGDHPSVSGGAPVQIGWEPQETLVRNLDLYEHMRGDRRHGRRELAIPVQTRGQILLRAGYSLEQIGNAALKVDETKKLRADTVRRQGWDRANMVLETTGKLPKGILGSFANVLMMPIKMTIQARSA